MAEPRPVVPRAPLRRELVGSLGVVAIAVAMVAAMLFAGWTLAALPVAAAWTVVGGYGIWSYVKRRRVADDGPNSSPGR